MPYYLKIFIEGNETYDKRVEIGDIQIIPQVEIFIGGGGVAMTCGRYGSIYVEM